MNRPADVPNHLFDRAARDSALVDFAGAPINYLVPVPLGIFIRRAIEACDELMGKKRPVVFRQRQHFGHFIGSYAHDTNISLPKDDLASFRK